MSDAREWEWFGNVGHLIVGDWCRFHLCTLVGDYLVSTVGEYWPDKEVRIIHARHADPKWLEQNSHLKGDYFDAAYMKRFGYETVGYDRKYETMVFNAGKKRCDDKDCGCGIPRPSDWSEIDSGAYNNAADAAKGHLELCRKWAAQPASRTEGKHGDE